MESGKLVLEKAEFNLEAELTALIDVFAVQCDNKNLFIALELAGKFQCPIEVLGSHSTALLKLRYFQQDDSKMRLSKLMTPPLQAEELVEVHVY